MSLKPQPVLQQNHCGMKKGSTVMSLTKLVHKQMLPLVVFDSFPVFLRVFLVSSRCNLQINCPICLMLLLFFASQVPGESLASGQQLPHHSLSYNALLCQPEYRDRAKFQSGGVLRRIRSAPSLITHVLRGEETHRQLHLSSLNR